MKLKAVYLLALALQVACAPITATPAASTEVVPTGYPAPETPTLVAPTEGYPAPVTETPKPPTATLAPTKTPVPEEVWEIWLNGYPCADQLDCTPRSNSVYGYYSVKTDGSGLNELSIIEFPPTPAIPEGAPVPMKLGPVAPPLLSPDESMVAYISELDGSLYVVEIVTANTVATFPVVTPSISKVAIRGYCWYPDNSGLIFLEIPYEQTPSVYSADIGTSLITKKFDLSGVASIQFAICSPSGEEIAFSVQYASPIEKNGIYVLDIESGGVRQILNNFWVYPVRVAPEK